MKEGLRSDSLSAEPENGEVLPSQVILEKKKDDIKEKDFDLNDENNLLCGSGSDKEPLVSSPREATGIGQNDCSGNQEYSEDGHLGERKIVKLVDNEKKRSRVDDDEENAVKKRKKKVKEGGLNGKAQASGRVLRSTFAVKCGGEEEGDKEESKDVVVGKGERGSGGHEDKMVNAQLEESNDFSDEVRKEVKRKRGRPSKVPESNRSDSVRRKKSKFKRGRPPKVKASDQSELEESDDFSDEVRKEVKRKRGRPPKVLESNQCDSVRRKKSKFKCGRPPKVKASDQSELEKSDDFSDEVRTEVKRKRGRPPKVLESDRSVSVRRKKLKFKRGRPPKLKMSDQSDGEGRKKPKNEHRRLPNMQDSNQSDDGGRKLKHKPGRPPKVKRSNEVLNVELNKGKKMGRFRKSEREIKARDSMRGNVPNNSYLENRLSRKVLKVKRFVPAREVKCGDMETEDNKGLTRLTSKAINALKIKEKEGKGEKTKRSEAKQLMRDRIVELLLGAGWTVEYRPRNDRAYHDAVYVNPDGKTHWSVTLAYRVFKKQYEGCGDDSKTTEIDPSFTLIPEEELSILNRVVLKQRNDKGKPKKERKVVTVKKKLSLSGKSLKGRIKGSSSLHKQDDSDGTLQKGIPMSVRNRKRQGTQTRKPCALLVRNSLDGAESDSDGYILYEGKRTVLMWMIDLATVPLNGKVQYLNRRKTQVLLEGRITKEGIQCDCCSEVFTISDFEIHAGSKLNQTFQNLYLENGKSLLQCLLDSWNKQDDTKRKGFHFVDVGSGDPNDDTCGICGDGGDLICCDGCPSTFHQICLDIKEFPSGDWHCLHCSCKFCGMVGEATYQKDNDNNTALSALFTCCLCEEKYHESCIQEKEATNDDCSNLSFCGKKCQELFERLQMLLGVKHELQEGFSWTLLHRFDVGSDVSSSEVPQQIECNSKLVAASLVMDECFLPLIDHRSGINLIHNIVYNFGSNFSRLNYSCFFTAILERGDEIIAAASIRIHGNQLAEMPFIGTRHMYRRQGMCRRLLNAIESVLCSLDVEKLVIPAISELTGTWTSVFGFKPLEASSKQKMRNMNMLVFPRVDMLQKPLLKHHLAGENMIHTDGLRAHGLKEKQTMDKVANNSDERCSGFDLNVPAEGTAREENDETTAAESRSQLLHGSLNDKSNVTNETVNISEFGGDAKCLVQLGAACENLETVNETVRSPQGTVCNAHEQIEETCEYHNAVSASMVKERKSIVRDNLNSHAEESGNCSDEINLTRPHDLELKASGENTITGDSEPTSQISQDVNDGICPASTKCTGSQILSKTSTITDDVVHPTSLSVHQRAQDVADSQCAVMSVDCSVSSCQGNVIDAYVNPSCHPSCGTTDEAITEPSFQPCMSNGVCTSTVVTSGSTEVAVDGV